MTNHRGPLTDLIPTLAMYCRHGGSDQTMHRLRAGGLEVDGATTLSDLAAQCNRTHDRARAEDILRSLVGLAGDDGLAALGALVALYPALLGIARRLIVTGVTLEQADVDVIAVAYQRIVELSEDPPRHVARAVIGGTWDRIRSQLRAEQRCALRQCRLEESDDQPMGNDGPGWSGRLEGVLIEAVAGGVIGAEAARVIHTTRVGGRSMRSVACDLGKREPAVRKVRMRAERTLIEDFRAQTTVPVAHPPPHSATHSTTEQRNEKRR
jgi:hypothetical protein